MPALNNLAGQKIGRLTVIDRADVTSTGKVRWRCSCDCGAASIVAGVDLKSGHTTSCGCRRDERNRTSALSHGLRDSPTYSTWTAMKTRCLNPRVKGYADYGGKGIRVCERWATSFSDFVADMGERPAGMTLDRWPNMRGDYEPGNCRWATSAEQHRNTTANAHITFHGETLTQADWAQRTGISQSTLSRRVRSGWSPEEALMLVPRFGLKRTQPMRSASGRFASKFGEEVDLP